MAAINNSHVEWRVVSRLHDLLVRLPEAEHDVTLTYALFTSTLCWTCQRLRETRVVGHHQDLWSDLNSEIALQSPWNFGQLHPQKNKSGTLDLETLPASWLLVGLRNAIAHGDHRNVLPHHTGERGEADRKLLGFKVTTSFKEIVNKQLLRGWGEWTVTLTRSEMRQIGLLVSERFVDALGADNQIDAVRHVMGA